MDKLAVCVEGYTEVVFVEKLIEEIAGKNRVHIEQKRISGGSRVPRTMRTITASKPSTEHKYYILIFDCGNDELVKKRIQEEHENLTRAGYSGIIGMRDVRPMFTFADVPKLELNLPKYIKTKFIPVAFILAIMEIEAWFLAEATHFPKIEPSITAATIKATLGFDPENDDMARRLCPAQDLNACYAIGGKAYTKNQAATTINALDYESIYLELRVKITYLDRLISAIESFLS
jgi:hypothetical protein